MQLFSIKDEDLSTILESYPEFADVLKVRALRRYHYLTKIRRQYQAIIKDDENKKLKAKSIKRILGFSQYKLNLNREKLVEVKLNYETLALKNICSDDEIPIHHSRDVNILKRQQKLLKKAKFLKRQISDLKQFSLFGMGSILETLSSID